MNWFYDMKIRTKLLISFILVTVLASCSALYCIFKINEINRNGIAVYERLNEQMNTISDLNSSFLKMRDKVGNILATRDMTGIDKLNIYMNELKTINETLETQWLESESSEHQRFNSYLEKLPPLIESVIAAGKKGDVGTVVSLVKEGSDIDSTLKSIQNSISIFTNLKITNLRSQLEANSIIARNTIIVVVIALMLCLLLAAGLGLLLAIVISRPVKALGACADKLALGEVDIEINSESKDEIGSLAKAFANMAENIRKQAYAAQMIAKGELELDIAPRSENDVLSSSIRLVADTLKDLVSEMNYLARESKRENFNAVGNSEKFLGGYRDIVDGVNNTLSIVRERVFWYEEILNSIPLPILVSDLDLNLTYINKPVEDYMGKSRSELVGKKSPKHHQEVVEDMRNGETQALFELRGHSLQANVAYLKNTRGDTIGHVEVIQDITARMRSINYQKEEAKRLSENLKLLAQGNLNLDFRSAEGDEYTVEESRTFAEINESLKTAVDSISEYIRDIINILNEISRGNLTVKIESDYKGDFVSVKESLGNILASLNKIIGEINAAADQVSEGARQVSSGSQALSQGATEQASSIEELTATISEIASQIKTSALSANRASELASKVKDSALTGKRQMEDMLLSMKNISESSKSISKIIKVIDEIAFQTNLLALNAAVEAARAGQYGKGFAVVAEEVRNLASRSAKAAKETTDLIENSISIVVQGEEKANKTAEALKTIIEGIDKAAEMVEEIAKASDEQASAIAQINKGIEQVSKVVQNNSATAEESAAASEELSNQAKQLKELVDRFSIAENGGTGEEFSEAGTGLLEKEASAPSSDEGIDMPRIDLGDADYGKY